jgi:hypothetical protein
LFSVATLDNKYLTDAVHGVAAGVQKGNGRDTGSRAKDRVATCRVCGKPFPISERQLVRYDQHCCSTRCISARSRAIALEQLAQRFTVPESTERQRRSAHKLVSGRIRRGAMVRPDTCQFCGEPCGPRAHHLDYNKPDEVIFLCDSCHKKCHYRPGFEAMALSRVAPTSIPKSKTDGQHRERSTSISRTGGSGGE